MTNEQILEAQRLLSDIRNALTVLTSTTDEDTLFAIVMGRMPAIFHKWDRLSFRERMEIFGPEDVSLLHQPLATIYGFAEIGPAPT